MLKLGGTNIKSMHLGGTEIKKAYLGNELVFEQEKPSRLPIGYTEVLYITSDNQCGIDTGIESVDFSQKKFRFVMDIQPMSYENYGESIFTSDAVSAHFFMRRMGAKNLQYGISNTTISDKTIDTSNKRLLIDCNAQNETLKVGVTSYSLGAASGLTQNIQIFASKAGGHSIKSNLYGCVVYSGSDKIRDFVPCTNPSGAVGLYDLIGSKFYGNTRTGTLTAGPSI